jgi:hypothetical protein
LIAVLPVPSEQITMFFIPDLLAGRETGAAEVPGHSDTPARG